MVSVDNQALFALPQTSESPSDAQSHAVAANDDPLPLDIAQEARYSTVSAQGYLSQQARALWSWADPERAARLRDRPWDLLQAVCEHYGARLEPAFVATLDPNQLEDDAWLDQAALLYTHTVAGAISAPESLTALRAPLLAALKRARDAYTLRVALLQPPADASRATAIYFDGFALRHACGLSLEQIAVSDALALPGSIAALSGAERLERLRARFADIGEDTQYPVGTVAHSLASTVLRIQTYLNLPLANGAQSEPQWAQAFQDLEAAWVETKNYPLHPRLLFALHLAVSSGAQLTDDDWREQLWQQIEPQLSDQPAALQLARDRLQQRQDEALTRRDALARLFGDSASGALGRLPSVTRLQAVTYAVAGLYGNSALLRRRQSALRLQARFTPLQQALMPGLARERISGSGAAGKLAALMRYAGERLRANYEAPPRFSRRAEAERQLSARGLSTVDLRRSRPYTLATHNPNITQDGFGTPVDEFLARADWSAFPGRAMRVGGRVLEPGALLQAAEDQFNQTLPEHGWVQAYAKEPLRCLGRVPWSEALESEVARIVGDYQTETESHRGWVRGLMTWINVVPVLGPIYNIEEGIRGRDPWQAVLGAVFLALDAFDLLAGEGNAARGESASAEFGAEARAEVAREPDAGEEIELEPLAGMAPSRHGLRHEDVLREQFAADAPASAGSEPAFATNLVALSQRSVKPSLARSHSSPPRIALAVDGMVRGTPVGERLTCAEVKTLIDRASDGEDQGFASLFARHFRVELHNTAQTDIDAARLFQSFYRHSITYRRLMNHYVATASDAGPWRIHIGEIATPRFGNASRPYTDFEHQAIYLPNDQAIGALQYMGPEGLAPVAPEQAYLHEMVHALTGARDPGARLDLLNRGPVVYLTDRILAESGHFAPPQVMYRREDALPALAAHETVEGNRERAAEAALAEDRYLDGYLSRQYRSSARLDASAAMGVVLARVKSAARLSSRSTLSVPTSSRFSLTPAPAGVSKAFGASASPGQFIQRLLDRSSTFRSLLARDAAVASEGWTLAWGSSSGPRVDRVSRRLTLPPVRGYYLHDHGRGAIEPQRQLAEALVEALSGLSPLSVRDSAQQRGEVLILAQQVLDEAGFHFSRRLSAAEMSHDAPLTWLTPARRRADAEDAVFRLALEKDTRLTLNHS